MLHGYRLLLFRDFENLLDTRLRVVHCLLLLLLFSLLLFLLIRNLFSRTLQLSPALSSLPTSLPRLANTIFCCLFCRLGRTRKLRCRSLLALGRLNTLSLVLLEKVLFELFNGFNIAVALPASLIVSFSFGDFSLLHFSLVLILLKKTQEDWVCLTLLVSSPFSKLLRGFVVGVLYFLLLLPFFLASLPEERIAKLFIFLVLL